MKTLIRLVLLIGLALGVLVSLAAFGFRIKFPLQDNPIKIHYSISNPYQLFLPLVLKMEARALTLGYYTGDQRSFDAIQSFSAYLRIVSADVYSVQLDGSIVGEDEFGVVEYDRAHGIQTYACVTNYNNNSEIDDFDPKLAHAAIITHKDDVISGLLSTAQHGKYRGINIDFENLAYSEKIVDDRMAFSVFIHDLANRLHSNGLKLVISVPGKTDDSIDNSWSYPFDFAILGKYADYLQLMTYDQHGPWSDPGPVSGIDWVEDCLVYASSLVDSSRLLIGLPAYGYDWDLTRSDLENEIYSASLFSWIEVPALLSKPEAVLHWDSASHSPFVTYAEHGHHHEAWYENNESIRTKSELVEKYHLAGLSMWSLGREDLSFWKSATQGFP
jgi:spore germination protein YaaH